MTSLRILGELMDVKGCFLSDSRSCDRVSSGTPGFDTTKKGTFSSCSAYPLQKFEEKRESMHENLQMALLIDCQYIGRSIDMVYKGCAYKPTDDIKLMSPQYGRHFHYQLTCNRNTNNRHCSLASGAVSKGINFITIGYTAAMPRESNFNCFSR